MESEIARYRPSTHQRGEDTRRRILETAIEIFGTYEYDGASTRLLAERAGVNLPAIQYYFGSKEGLYRAAIDTVIADIDRQMAPVAERVATALADPDAAAPTLLALLLDMLDAFAALVLDGDPLQSRKRLIARAEIESSTALDALYHGMMRRVFTPCAALVGRLLHQPAADEQVMLRTIALVGQITIFCKAGAQCALDWRVYDEDRVRQIQTIVRQQTEAIIRCAGGVAP
jgi:TetR/AcrR family transcriptional regulator, regulator of cefoperazone and chloramphenicol sensitivity